MQTWTDKQRGIVLILAGACVLLGMVIAIVAMNREKPVREPAIAVERFIFIQCLNGHIDKVPQEEERTWNDHVCSTCGQRFPIAMWADNTSLINKNSCIGTKGVRESVSQAYHGDRP